MKQFEITFLILIPPFLIFFFRFLVISLMVEDTWGFRFGDIKFSKRIIHHIVHWMVNWFHYKWDTTKPNECCCPFAYICWKSGSPFEKIITKSAYTVDSKTWNGNRSKTLPDNSVSHSNSSFFCCLRFFSFLEKTKKKRKVTKLEYIYDLLILQYTQKS